MSVSLPWGYFQLQMLLSLCQKMYCNCRPKLKISYQSTFDCSLIFIVNYHCYLVIILYIKFKLNCSIRLRTVCITYIMYVMYCYIHNNQSFMDIILQWGYFKLQSFCLHAKKFIYCNYRPM
jgi:hypothetical protein